MTSGGSTARTETTLNLSDAVQVLAAQSFSAHLGTRVVQFGGRQAVLELEVRDDMRQQHGHVHGGVVSYLVDNAITFAAGAALGPAIVTAGFSVEYLRPARSGLLRAEAHVVKAGRTYAVVRCDVTESAADSSRIVAVGLGRVVATSN